jgi:hypothetical protein
VLMPPYYSQKFVDPIDLLFSGHLRCLAFPAATFFRAFQSK